MKINRESMVVYDHQSFSNVWEYTNNDFVLSFLISVLLLLNVQSTSLVVWDSRWETMSPGMRKIVAKNGRTYAKVRDCCFFLQNSCTLAQESCQFA